MSASRTAVRADLEDLILRFGPASGVRAGPLVRRLARLRPGERVTVELVVAGGALEVAAAATLAGERVEETRSLPVPAGDPGGSDAPPLYAFLEPRALTTDRVTLAPEGGGAPVEAAGGVFAVRGGGRYLLTIHPTRPAATGVRVYAAAGRVEVEPQAAAAGAWPFLVTVVDNPLLTQAVRLDYDVEAAGQPPLRGEFYLSVRPATVRRWLFALTAGAAVTVKGVTAIVPALWRDDPGRDFVLEDLPELLAARATDAWQAVSIPPHLGRPLGRRPGLASVAGRVTAIAGASATHTDGPRASTARTGRSTITWPVDRINVAPDVGKVLATALHEATAGAELVFAERPGWGGAGVEIEDALRLQHSGHRPE